MALRSDGSMVEWGNNYDPSDSIYYGHNFAPAENDFMAVSAGDHHSLALALRRQPGAWGCTTKAVRRARRQRLRGIAAGGDHGMALRSDGTIEAWGMDNRPGQ